MGGVTLDKYVPYIIDVRNYPKKQTNSYLYILVTFFLNEEKKSPREKVQWGV